MTDLFLHCVQVFRNLRDSGHYEDSARELDVALAELTSDPNFPKVLLRNRFVYDLFTMIMRVLISCYVMRRASRICDRRRFRRLGSLL